MGEIAIDDVSKRFPDGTEAIRNACFTIREGEFFVLVGPSGCGKSTLLNMLVGLEEVTSGTIRVNGKAINDLDPRHRNMAMVFQSYALYPHMSVWDNMAFPLRLTKLPRPEIARRVQEAATILGLTELLQRKPRSLSGGQRQRVAMGRAIVRKPAAFLLDEPLSNLDARLRVQMRTELARLQRRLATTTVYVTHDQTEAMTLGDRIAVLRRGEVQQVGTPRALYARPANLFVAGFIGSPAMNFLPARVQDGRLLLPMAALTLPPHLQASLASGQRELIAGIRPEHLCDAGAPAGGTEHTVTFEVDVDVAEWVGADLYVHASVPGADRPTTLIARLDPAAPVREGKSITLRLDLAQVHLFNADDEKRKQGLDDK